MRMSSRFAWLSLRLVPLALGLMVVSSGARVGAAERRAAAGSARLRTIGAEAGRGRAAAVVVEEGALAHSALLYPLDALGRLQGGGDAYAQASRCWAVSPPRSGCRHRARPARAPARVRRGRIGHRVDRRLLAERFGAATPAVTIVESRMPHAGVLVAMDAVAATARPPAGGLSERIVVAGLPPAAGDGAHVAVQPEGPFVIVSGRAAPGEFEAAVRGDDGTAARRPEDRRPGFDHVVQVKAFLGDMARAEQLQRLVAGTFKGTAPPQVVTEWRDASLPVEIELVATAPGAAGSGERLTLRGAHPRRGTAALRGSSRAGRFSCPA